MKSKTSSSYPSDYLAFDYISKFSILTIDQIRQKRYNRNTPLMNYQTFQPHPDLESLINCYWTLEVPADNDSKKQRIVPDGCIEMAFILGDDIMRYTSQDEFILQPRAMLGQKIIQARATKKRIVGIGVHLIKA